MSDPETERLRADVKRMLRTLEEADAALKQARETCDMAWRMVLILALVCLAVRAF